jgi:hypothetical protein
MDLQLKPSSLFYCTCFSLEDLLHFLYFTVHVFHWSIFSILLYMSFVGDSLVSCTCSWHVARPDGHGHHAALSRTGTSYPGQATHLQLRGR